MDTWKPEEIGDTAGKVWNFLQRSGESSLTAVERGVGAPKPLVCMAIGWLAREGKIALRQEKRTVQLWLTDAERGENSRL
ncbi:MAG: winged helix-turn-helix domain-containing protein [Candidatus Binatia bacterium]